MKRKWLYYLACIPMPHIMLVVGLIFLSKASGPKKVLGKHLCVISAIILVVGSLIYYTFFTPLFGLD